MDTRTKQNNKRDSDKKDYAPHSKYMKTNDYDRYNSNIYQDPMNSETIQHFHERQMATMSILPDQVNGQGRVQDVSNINQNCSNQFSYTHPPVNVNLSKNQWPVKNNVYANLEKEACFNQAVGNCNGFIHPSLLKNSMNQNYTTDNLEACSLMENGNQNKFFPEYNREKGMYDNTVGQYALQSYKDYNRMPMTCSMSNYMPQFNRLQPNQNMELDILSKKNAFNPSICAFKDVRKLSKLGKEKIKVKNPTLSDRIDPADKFTDVDARMSLLSSTQKYKVTVAEVQRRLSSPECLNASLLGGVLRRAKCRGGGPALRADLDKIGLSIPAGRRKTSPVTLFTSLVEGEALRLARDWDYINQTTFPVKMMAQFNVQNQKDYVKTTQSEILIFKKVLNDFTSLLKLDRSPLCSTQSEPILPRDKQKLFTNYSNLTHGFGASAVLSVLSILENYSDNVLKICESPNKENVQNSDSQNDNLNNSSPHKTTDSNTTNSPTTPAQAAIVKNSRINVPVETPLLK